MKFRKKILAVIISVLLIFSVLPFSFSASAAEVGYGDFFFTVDNSNYTAELKTYEGSASEIEIPGEVYGYKVTSIDSRVFYENSTLQSVTIPDTLESIGVMAFAFCDNLKSVTLGSYITSLGYSAFLGCTSLEQAVVDCDIDTLPTSTFEKCSALNSVTLADNITSIGNSAFKECSSLSDLPTENIVSYGSNCFQETNASEVVIADGVQTLPWMCFANCNELTDVTIPKTVTNINSTAFYNVNLQYNVTIKCYCDSYAHNYAVENRIDHMLIDRFESGDVNGDGVIDILDSTEIQKFAAEKTEFTDEQFEMADINKDTFADVMDALLVQKYAIGKYDIPPIIIRY